MKIFFIKITISLLLLSPVFAFALSTSDFRITINSTEVEGSRGGSSGSGSGSVSGYSGELLRPIEEPHQKIVKKIEELIQETLLPIENQPTSEIKKEVQGTRLMWNVTIEGESRTVVIVIPEALFGRIAAIEVKPVAFEEKYALGVINGVIYDISAYDKKGVSQYIFKEPLTITVPYPKELKQYELGVFRFDEGARNWVRIKNAYFSDDIVTFTTNHLSLFSVMAVPKNITVPDTLVPASGSGVPPYSATEENRIHNIAKAIVFTLYVLTILTIIIVAKILIRYFIMHKRNPFLK